MPWKNGKGLTTELAINPGASLSDFKWRLSIASVTEDGIFSDFSGYTRNLVLIEGESIHLTHDNNKTDKLTKHLDFSTFDGSCKTFGKLQRGGIKDFNIMTAKDSYKAEVSTYTSSVSLKINHQGLVFIYSLSNVITVTDNENSVYKITQGDLLHLTDPIDLEINGQSLIVIALSAV